MKYEATINISIEAPSSQLAERVVAAIVEAIDARNIIKGEIDTVADNHRDSGEFKLLGAKWLGVVAERQQ